MKFPARLIIQIWDNDIFTPDDFLGEIRHRARDHRTENSFLLMAFLWAQGSWSWICLTCPYQPGMPTCAPSR